MKHKLLTILLIVTACLTFCACGNEEPNEKNMISDAVYSYEAVSVLSVIVPPEAAEQYSTTDRAILDEETIARLKAETEEVINLCCSGNTADRVYYQYCDMIDRYYADSTMPMAGEMALDICFDHGVLDFKTKNVKIDGNTATAEAKYVGYNTRIIKEANDQYTIHMTYSKHNCGYELVKESDLWLVTAITENHQEGMPSGYNGNKGTYDTFEEAYNAALELDPEKENPFF